MLMFLDLRAGHSLLDRQWMRPEYAEDDEDGAARHLTIFTMFTIFCMTMTIMMTMEDMGRARALLRASLTGMKFF